MIQNIFVRKHTSYFSIYCKLGITLESDDTSTGNKQFNQRLYFIEKYKMKYVKDDICQLLSRRIIE